MRKIIQSEFPEKVDWKEFKKLIDFNVEIWVPVRKVKEYYKWKKVIENKHIKTGAWPVLDKKEGYWFSGHCSKKAIDKLDQFKDLELVKIDLEFPLPNLTYSDHKFYSTIRIGWDTLKLLFKKPKNYNYLINKIKKLDKGNFVINEFAFLKFWRKRMGIHYPYKTYKTYMYYTSVGGSIFRYLLILSNLIHKWIQKPESMSIGLIGPGIFKAEGIYKNIKQFKQDLKIFKPRNIVIYSVEGIMSRKNPKEWVKVIKEYK